MSKIRINDLARELEVKSKAILDVLTEVGVTEKKTHSSSIEDHEAVKVREHFRSISEAQSSSKASRSSRAEAEGIKTKIDLSHISKPGDVLNAIRAKQQVSSPAAPSARSATPAAVVEAKPAASATTAAKARAIAPPPVPAVPRDTLRRTYRQRVPIAALDRTIAYRACCGSRLILWRPRPFVS